MTIDAVAERAGEWFHGIPPVIDGRLGLSQFLPLKVKRGRRAAGDAKRARAVAEGNDFPAIVRRATECRAGVGSPVTLFAPLVKCCP